MFVLKHSVVYFFLPLAITELFTITKMMSYSPGTRIAVNSFSLVQRLTEHFAVGAG